MTPYSIRHFIAVADTAAPALSAAAVGLQSTAGSWRKSIIERRRGGVLSEPVVGTMYCMGAFTYNVRCFWGIYDLPTVVRYFTTLAYLVKSHLA